MEYKELLKTQVQLINNQVEENKKLKSQIHILETIIRNYVPIIEKRNEN